MRADQEKLLRDWITAKQNEEDARRAKRVADQVLDAATRECERLAKVVANNLVFSTHERHIQIDAKVVRLRRSEYSGGGCGEGVKFEIDLIEPERV